MRLAVTALIAFALAGCATPPQSNDVRAYASPSDLVAAEAAFNRLAQEKGQWTAFRETATADAVMFVPTLSNAQAWLKGRKDPPKAVTWQPHKVFMSCDGTLGLTSGAAQWPGGGHGRFVTIWQRQTNVPGSAPILKQYKWVFDTGESVDAPLAAPDSIETRIANCTGKPVLKEILIIGTTTANKIGTSADGTLRWSAASFGDGSRTLFLEMWDGKNMTTIFEDKTEGQR